VNIPTSLSAREANCLHRWAHNKRVIEVGALLGYSTIQLSGVAASVISIDRHEGYTGPTLKPYLFNIWQYGRANVLPVVGDALTELPKFWGDFGFIDLTGQKELTSAALKAIRCPIVGIHDFTRTNCEGVAEAIKGMDVLEVSDTLVIVRNKNA
jgi:hypothetical protein